MYEYFNGQIIEKSPTHVVMECNGVGYFINVSLNTSSAIEGSKCLLYTHFVVREDAQLLYGFATTEEREVFRKLISVSGVGVNTARTILSTLNTEEVKHAIISGDVAAFKSVKGIGAKTAQRILVDLKDKIGAPSAELELLTVSNNTVKEEALIALEVLGFAKKPTEKVVDRLVKQSPDITVEELIKQALNSI